MPVLLSVLLWAAASLPNGFSGCAQEQHIASERLSPDASELGIAQLPLTIRMDVLSCSDGILTVCVINDSGYRMPVSADWQLELLSEDGTCSIASGRIEEADEESLLWTEDCTRTELALDLGGPGSLSPGRYRIRMGELSADFSLAEQNTVFGR